MRGSRSRGWTWYGVTVGVAAIGLTVLWAADVPARLGISEQTARNRFEDTVNHNYVAYDDTAAKAFKALPASARAALVNDAVAWAKAYVASPAYKTSYAQKREKEKPTAPVLKSVDEEVKKKLDEQQKQLDDFKKTVAAMPANQRATYEPTVKQMEAQIANPQTAVFFRQSIEADHAEAQRTYQERLKKWQDGYPADPAASVVRELKVFLDTTANVDFAAKLGSRNNLMRFVDDVNEKKSREWKFCFRAGKEATTAARAGATAWLAELSGK